jgi:hypothetical protein
MVQKDVEALRDGAQAAREREQAEREFEQTLVAQEKRFELGSQAPVFDEAELEEMFGEEDRSPEDLGGRAIEYRGDERTFEGEGRHPLDEQ